MRGGAALALFALLATPSVAHAQLAAAGAPSSIAPPAGVAPVRWPAVAYAPPTDTFLAVSGAGHIGGVRLDGTGAPVGASFVIGPGATGTFAQAPRVAFADDAFVVTWHETIPGDAVRVRARFVGTDGTLGPDFDVSPTGTNWEMGAPAAWSSASHALLVAWHSTVDTRIYAQRVDRAGAMLGGPITVDARAIYFRDPTVAYHAATDTFFVAYAGCVGTNDCFVDAQRIRAATGEIVGAPIALDASIDAGYVPEIAYDARAARMLVVWDRIEPGSGGFQARTIDGDGTPSAAPVLVTSAAGAYDANGLSWDALSGSFVLVTHGTNEQDVALELASDGTPIGALVPFGPTGVGGNFNPRVAAREGHGEWIAVTSTDFATMTAQRLSTTTRAPASDAGVTPEDAATTSDAGPGAPDAGSTGDAGTPPTDAGRRASVSPGCGCVAGRPGALGGAAWLGLLVALARLRRRR